MIVVNAQDVILYQNQHATVDKWSHQMDILAHNAQEAQLQAQEIDHAFQWIAILEPQLLMIVANAQNVFQFHHQNVAAEKSTPLMECLANNAKKAQLQISKKQCVFQWNAMIYLNS